MSSEPAADADKLKLYAFQLFSKLDGAVTAGMVHLGDQLGLYRAMKRAGRPLTTNELAQERRPARAMGAGVGLQPGRGKADRGRRRPNGSRSPRRLWPCSPVPTTPHSAWGCSTASRRRCGRSSTLARASSPASVTTTTATAPVGRSASSEASSRGTTRICCRSCCRRSMVWSTGWPRERHAIDVGCGAGGAVLMMAAAFPRSNFVGYDISRYALDRAHEKLSDAGLPNAQFFDPRESPMPSDHSVDARDNVRLHPRHDPSAADDGDDPGRAGRRRHAGCSSTSRHSTRSSRTCARTRWRR